MRVARRIAPWFHQSRSGDKESASYRAWKKAWQQLPNLRKPTLLNRINDSDWDLLIILDAARYDTLSTIADAIVTKEISPASSTPEFLAAVEQSGLFAKSWYISANPQVERRNIGSRHVEYLSDGWNNRLETILPGTVYERATELVLEGESVVAHTVQPHYPHICRIGDDVEPVPGGLHPAETDINLHDVVQGYLTNGNYNLTDAQRSYELCTEFAWEEAVTIAQDLRRQGYTVAITADHGESFGEFGFVEHPVGVSIPQLRYVPWVEFSPTDPGERDVPDRINDRLSALGYRD